VITDRNVTPTQFRARLSEFLTGGPCDTFCIIYNRLYEDAKVYEAEDDALREAKDEIEDLREALAQANLDLAEAKAEIENAKEKPKKRG